MADAPPLAAASPISGASVRRGDRVFGGMSKAAGVTVLVIMAAIAAFLIWRAIPSLTNNTANFLTEQSWNPDGNPPVFGIAALLFGTLVSASIAMLAGGSGRDRHRPVHRPLRPPPPGVGVGLRHGPAGGRPVDHLRSVGPAGPDVQQRGRPEVDERLPRLDDRVQEQSRPLRQEPVHRLARAGHHDPAHRRGREPRGDPAGPAPGTRRLRSPSGPPAGRWCGWPSSPSPSRA